MFCLSNPLWHTVAYFTHSTAHLRLHYQFNSSHWAGAASLELYCTEEVAAWPPPAGGWGQEEGGGAAALNCTALYWTAR